MAQRFIVDEDLPEAVAVMLSRMGYWAKHVRQISLKGAGDQEVFQYAQTKKATIITADKGFGDVRRFPVGSHHGIIVVRLKNRSRDNILQRLAQVIVQLRGKSLKGRLVIVSESKTRVRGDQS